MIEPGAELGNLAVIIPGVPRFPDGERVLLFLKETPQGRWAVTDLAMGRFVFVTDDTGRQYVRRSEGNFIAWTRDGAPHREPFRDAERFLRFLRIEASGGMGLVDYVTPASRPVHATSDVGKTMPGIVTTAVGSPSSYTTDIGSGRGSRWMTFPSAVTFYTQNGASSTGCRPRTSDLPPGRTSVPRT